MVTQGPDFYLVLRAKKANDGRIWHVIDFSGRVKARRAAYKNAKETAERLSMGMTAIPERLQVLRGYPKLRLVKKGGTGNRYTLKTGAGVIVKRFKKRFVAEWWLGRYNTAREARQERKRNTANTTENEKTLLDAVVKKWLLADSRMLYEERATEIESLLRMGLA